MGGLFVLQFLMTIQGPKTDCFLQVQRRERK
jgi:hypothetical protein